MIILSISDISGLYNQFKSLKEKVKYCLYEMDRFKPDTSKVYYIYKNGLLPSYYNALNNLIKLKDSMNFSIELIDNLKINDYTVEMHGKLQLMSIECEKALGILQNQIKMPLTKIQKNKLSSIEDQVNDLELDPYYEKNIKLAIEHFEKGNFLACSLISSRIIVYSMDQIPQLDFENESKKQKKSKDEKRINYLVEKGLIDKKDRSQKTRIFKYVTNARNFLVHDIKVFPDASDSMSLLGDCVDILKILTKIEEI